jgi:hypothetical protein
LLLAAADDTGRFRSNVRDVAQRAQDRRLVDVLARADSGIEVCAHDLEAAA